MLRDTVARTVINLDDELVREAMRRAGLKRKVDVVNEALRVLVAQERVRSRFERVRGRVAWEGDPHQMRRGGARSR